MLLSFDTSSRWCSVALFEDDNLLVHQKLSIEQSHAERLMPMIDGCLALVGRTILDVQKIAIAIGPGSYTGLRIGASTAKGLAYASDIPVFGINTLASMAHHAMKFISADCIISSIDARRNEIYTAVYDKGLNEILSPQPMILDKESFKRFDQSQNIWVVGDGAEKIRTNLTYKNHYLYAPRFTGDAVSVGELAAKESVPLDIAYFEPEYIKPFYHGPKS